ncbi:MAG: fibronectin type III domain-containing protein [bacterium]
MKRLEVLKVLALFSLVLLTTCTEENPVKPEEEFAPPRNLTYITDSTSVRLIWQHSTSRNLEDFLGYFVYVATQSIASIDQDSILRRYLVNRTPLRDTTCVVTNLQRGTRYYFHVRAVKGTDTTEYALSRASNEVDTAPVLIGSGTLYEFSSTLGNPSGFSFAENRAYSMVYTNASHIDIYLGTTQSDDSAGDLVLKSPDLVQSAHAEWDTRVSQIKSLGTGWENFNQTTDAGWSANRYELVSLGRVYAIKTPDNHYVKLEITNMSGSFPNRTVTFRYAYQPITNYGHFKR